jgi:hypothetical protein
VAVVLVVVEGVEGAIAAGGLFLAVDDVELFANVVDGVVELSDFVFEVASGGFHVFGVENGVVVPFRKPIAAVVIFGAILAAAGRENGAEDTANDTAEDGSG